MNTPDELIAGENPAIRVIVAHAEIGFVESLRGALASEDGLILVGQTGEAAAVSGLAASQQANVLVVEEALFHALKAQDENLAGIRSLVTAHSMDRTTIIKAFVQGARAVVPREASLSNWPGIIRTVVAREYWLGKESTAILVQAIRDYFQEGPETKSSSDFRLTRREVEIIDKVANGHSNKQVGQAFSICERTVKHHLTNIFAKVGVSSRLELALFARNLRIMKTTQSLEGVALPKGLSAGRVERTNSQRV